MSFCGAARASASGWRRGWCCSRSRPPTFSTPRLALVDLDIMVRVDAWRTAVTPLLARHGHPVSRPLAHVSGGLLKLARRSTIRLPPWELLQIATGLTIPFLLLPHIVNTRGARLLFGINDTYAYELARLWPDSAWLQSTLLLLVWVHGCIGLHYWLRLTPTYRTIAPLLLAVAVFVPVAALAGFSVGGREMQMVVNDPAAFQALKQATHWPSPETAARLADMRALTRIVFGTLLSLALGAILVRSLRQRLARRIRIEYAAGPVVRAPVGPTLLEVSRQKRIPHASVCGGRARCSTCRVRILRGAEFLSPPAPAEAATLASIKAPPDTRLACQLRLASPATVLRIVRPRRGTIREATVEATDEHGVERPVAVLYFDVREFTLLSEHRLPYDVVFLLNRLFEAVGDAIHAEGGWIDRYTGDGLVAIFGKDVGRSGRLPAGAACGARHRLRPRPGRCRPEERGQHHPAHRHGIARRPGRPRPDRPPQVGQSHRRRQHRQYRQPAGIPEQGAGRSAGLLGRASLKRRGCRAPD